MWLPEPERPGTRFSFAHRFALDFLFHYCAEMAAWITTWPASHPLFYSLPKDESEARSRIAFLVEWILSPSGVPARCPSPYSGRACICSSS